MKRIALALCLIAAMSRAATENEPAQILNKTLEALGGRQKLEKLQTLIATGKVEVAGLQGTYNLQMKAPDQMRLDLDLGVVKQTRAYDGKVAWTKQASVAEQKGGDLQRTKRSALFLPLLQYSQTGTPVTVKGKEPVNQTETFVLEFRLGEGQTEQFYIDSKKYLPVRETRQAPNRKGIMEPITTDFADYRDVNGVQFPFSITQTQPGQVMAIRLDKIETNVPISAELFQNPTAKFAGQPYEVSLNTIPHHIYKENDGVWEPGSNESFYFLIVVAEKNSRPLDPVSATMKFYSGQTLVKTVHDSDAALKAIRATSLGGFANEQEIFDLTYSFSEPVKSGIDRLMYAIELEGEDGSKISKELDCPIEEYIQKTKLIFPLKGKFIVANAHDFNEPHHDEWSQHYAYDILGLGPNYEFAKNDARSNEDFYTWGREVIAAADGTVVYARNDVPGNPTVGVIDNKIFMSRPDPMWAVGGNDVVIDHGNGEFSFFAHMQQGSVKVKKGDHVKQGDVIGLLGNTGNSDGPHLHYHLMACETIFRCDGLPSHFENVYEAFSGEKLKAPAIKRGIYMQAK